MHYITLHLTTNTTTTTTLHNTTLHYTNYTTLHYNYSYNTLQYTTLDHATLYHTTVHNTAVQYTALRYATLQLHYFTPHYTRPHYTLNHTTVHNTTVHYTTLITLYHNYNCNCSCNYTTLITLHYNYNSATRHCNYDYNCATPHYIQQSWWGDHCNHCNHSKKHESNHLSVHQWIRSAIRESQQPISPIGFLFLKLPPPPCAVLRVHIPTLAMLSELCTFYCPYTPGWVDMYISLNIHIISYVFNIWHVLGTGAHICWHILVDLYVQNAAKQTILAVGSCNMTRLLIRSYWQPYSSLALWVMVPVESQSLNIFEQARRRHSQTPVQNVQGCQSCKFYYASEARQKSRMNWTTNFHITATIHYISLRDKVMHGTSRGRCIGHTLLLCLEPKLGFKTLRHKNLQDAAMWFTWSQSG